MEDSNALSESELSDLTSNQLRAILDLEASVCDTLLDYEEEWRGLLCRPFAGVRLFLEQGPFTWVEPGGIASAVERCQGHIDALRELVRERMIILGRLQAHLGRMTLARSDKDLRAWTENGVRLIRLQLAAAAVARTDASISSSGGSGGSGGSSGTSSSPVAEQDVEAGTPLLLPTDTALAVQEMVSRGGAELEPRVREHAPMSRVRRHWLLLSIATPVAAVLLLVAWKDRQRIQISLRSAKLSLAIFLREHITEPAQAIYEELFNNTRASLTDEPAIEDTRRSLQRMLADFVKEKYPKMPLAEQRQIVNDCNMSVVSLEYEKSILSSVKNIVSGDILRMLLIQVQFLKKELLTAMSAIETLTYENEFNLRIMATLPAFIVAWAAYQGGYSAYYFLKREKSRKATFAGMRSYLLAMERLLNLRNTSEALTRAEAEAIVGDRRGSGSGSGGASDGGDGRKDGVNGGSGSEGRQSAAAAAADAAAAAADAAAAARSPTLGELDLGRFFLLVWQLRRVLQRHPHRFNRVDLDSLTEDLAELTGERGLVSVPQQLNIVQRMQRSYRFLQVRGGAGLLPLG